MAYEAAQPEAKVISLYPSYAVTAEEKGDYTIERLFSELGVEVEEEALAA